MIFILASIKHIRLAMNLAYLINVDMICNQICKLQQLQDRTRRHNTRACVARMIDYY